MQPRQCEPRRGVGTPLSPTRAYRCAGVALVVAFRGGGLPEVLHWGADLGQLDAADLAAADGALARGVSSSALDASWPLTVMPTERDGWQGRPGLAGAREGAPLLPDWRVVEIDDDASGFALVAEADGLRLRSSLRLDAAGIVLVDHAVENVGGAAVHLAALDATMPVPGRADELLEFGGRWTRERDVQRRPLGMGSFARETRHGRAGHDAPLLTIVGTSGFDDAAGEVWAAHLAWSADAVHRADRLPEGRCVLGVGELLRTGEIVLAAGESFVAPTAWFAWSDEGIDGLSQRFHRALRARPSHPSTPRPVVLNTWEAVYFRHELEPLTALADVAADLGVERFVLDDGWFTGRRDDRAGLGDWTVDADVWPGGLHALVDHVRSRGMGFGLWVEPEMINPDSDLARAHPEWVLGPADHEPRPWRHQQVLDLARPEAFAWILERLDALLSEYPIEYLKWDHNRDLLEAVHAGRSGVDAQTRAVYALLDELRRRHPAVEIESCSSGGARVDLGILARTDRVWASDTNDPLERVRIQRWTEALLPPELIGSHVGDERAHTTHRSTSLRFRMAATLFASAGIEADVTRLSDGERDQLRAWIAEYKRLRPLMHGGRLLHRAVADSGACLTGAVSEDGTHALYRLTRERTGEWAVPPALMLPGLDADRTYSVRVLPSLSAEHFLDARPVPWIADGEVTLSGAVLGRMGLRVPLLAPASALVLEAIAV